METREQSAQLTEVGDLVVLPAGRYRLGEPGEERDADVGALLIGRHPVTNALLGAFAADAGPPRDTGLAARLGAPQLAGHPATGMTYADALAFCAWASERAGRRVRLPTGTQWEAAARGDDCRPWPWGDVFDPDRCACAEGNAWTTAPVDAHPTGASPCGAEQLAGNVWEWVGDPPDEDGWRRVRGGCHLDHAWGVRASRSLAADPLRATHTTGFRIAMDIDEEVP
ncbi:MAG: formylglycine-generating enzyme family protein [Thermoleophilia bacterium]